MDLEHCRWIYPDKYCRCSYALHNCNKEIKDFETAFHDAMESLCLNRWRAKI
jgi:hypothetical protein